MICILVPIGGAAIKIAVQDGQRPSLNDIPLDIPETFKILTRQCWSQDPQHRPSFTGEKLYLYYVLRH